MRKVIHVDMDCFFAAVEVRDRPELRGQPVAVGGQPGQRGVIAASNYEARKFGVRSAMSSGLALQKCPQLVLVAPSFEKYKEVSSQIRKIFYEYTDTVEPLSLDEAFLELGESSKVDLSATQTALEIRRRIYEETGLTASAGIAPNPFLAKVASDWKKPNGQFTIPPRLVEDFVKKLNVGKIPGVGPVTEKKLEQLGIKTCLELQAKSKLELQQVFGKWGSRLYELSRGQDDRVIGNRSARKTLSVERTFSEDLPNLNACLNVLPGIISELQKRLQPHSDKLKVKTLFVKLKFSDFKSTTVDDTRINKVSYEVLKELLERGIGRSDKAVRLIGLGVRFEVPDGCKPEQLQLFPS